jgi:hypothetical protein
MSRKSERETKESKRGVVEKKLASTTLRGALSSNKRLNRDLEKQRSTAKEKLQSLLQSVKENNALVTDEEVGRLMEAEREQGLYVTVDVKEAIERNKRLYEDQVHRLERQMRNEIDEYFGNYSTHLADLQSSTALLEEKLLIETKVNKRLEDENKLLQQKLLEHSLEEENWKKYAKEHKVFEQKAFTEIGRLRELLKQEILKVERAEKITSLRQQLGPGFEFPTTNISSSSSSSSKRPRTTNSYDDNFDF